MPRTLLRAALVVAVGLAAVALAVLVESRTRRPTSPLPVASGVAGWQGGPDALHDLTEVAAAVHEGRIWVAGGLGADGTATAAVQVLDPTSGAWDLGPPLPEPIHHSALVSDGDQLFLVGGYRADGTPSAAVHLLEADGWIEHRPLPEPRGAGAAAWDGAGRLVYAGGVGPAGVSADVWAQVDHGWEPYGRLPEPTEHTAATSDGAGTIYVLGGRRGGLDTNSARVTAIDSSGGRSLGQLPTPRGGVAAFWWASVGACLVGGESPGGTHPEVECIDAAGRSTRLPDLARPRHGLGAAVVDGRAYVLLGGDRPGLFVSDAVEVLELP